LACDDKISIDWALVILGNNSREKFLIFLFINLSIFSLFSYGFKIPIKYVGVGEKVGDLKLFHKGEFVSSFFD